MDKPSEKDLSVINGDRHNREAELVELIFRGTNDEIGKKLDQLSPKGKLSLVSDSGRKSPAGK